MKQILSLLLIIIGAQLLFSQGIILNRLNCNSIASEYKYEEQSVLLLEKEMSDGIWVNSDRGKPNENIYVFKDLEEGNYRVTLIVPKEYKFISNKIEIDCNDQKNKYTKEPFDVDLFPNPTSSVVNLTIKPFDNLSYSYQILSLNNKILRHGAIKKDESEINLSNLKPGLYFIIIYKENVSITKKLIIQ